MVQREVVYDYDQADENEKESGLALKRRLTQKERQSEIQDVEIRRIQEIVLSLTAEKQGLQSNVSELKNELSRARGKLERIEQEWDTEREKLEADIKSM